MKRPLVSLLLCAIVTVAYINADASARPRAGLGTSLHVGALREPARAQLTPLMEVFAGTLVFQVDSQVKLGSKVTAVLAAGDTLLFQYYRNDSLIISRRSVKLADSSFVAAPPYSSTTPFRGCAVIERGGRASGNKSARPCWAWSFVRGAAPPVITKLERLAIYGVPTIPGGPWARRRKPDGTLPAGTDSNTARLCGYGVLNTGEWLLAENSKPYATCDSIYAVRVSERRV